MSDDKTREAAAIAPPADLNPRRDAVLDFDDRPLGQMTPKDYDAIGFMAGLEVHQQLLTRSKLFCRCPAGCRAREVHAEVLRHMRPTLSELGEYDGTALMEFKTKKEIVYRLDRSCVCTYELDDTPPFEIDEQAVRIAIEACRLFDLDLVSEIHVMRKQYLDGSIPTGFQRTAMIGLRGEIPFRCSELGGERALRIRQLSLEEDSCREVSDIGHRIVFLTDRLGMPLIETVTEPDLLTPSDVREGGRLLADVVRATEKVRRGPGAARQDVNVSVAGGRRVEIKGVCHHRGLPLLVHNEAFRQLNLLRLRAELILRGARTTDYDLPAKGTAWEVSGLAVDAGSMLRNCAFAPVTDALARGETLCAVRLPHFAGLLGRQLQPGVTFAREFADRVRVIACLSAQPFLIHSDVADIGLGPLEWRQLRAALGATDRDGIFVLWGPRDDVATGAREILARAQEALVGVPSETRQAFPDGTNGFERILPGPDRMYPDTDTPPVPIPDAWILEVGERLPEPPWRREARYREAGLDDERARSLARAPWASLFDELQPTTPAGARRLAHALDKRLVFYWRETRSRSLPPAARLAPLLRALEEGRIDPDGFEAAFDSLLRQQRRSTEEVLEPFLRDAPAPGSLDSLARQTADAAHRLRTADPAARLRWAMGQVMPALRGRVDPRDLRARLERALSRSSDDDR